MLLLALARVRNLCHYMVGLELYNYVVCMLWLVCVDDVTWLQAHIIRIGALVCWLEILYVSETDKSH